MNSDLYCDILVNKLKPGIRNKRRGKLSKGVLFLHDNARPHTSCKTVSTIIKLGFEVLEHPAYSPDLAPSDYFLFGLLKKELKGKRFDSDEDVQKVVQDFFHTLPKSAYKEGIYKLPERWRRCIESQVTGLSVYLGIMRCLREAVRLKRPERWQNNDWILHVGNTRPHTVHVVLQFLAKHSTIQIPHPPYSPDLAPNDFFLYPKLKINLKGRKFDNVDMIQAESKATLRNLSKSDFISCFDN
ncbi:hypothetical protein LAZ67_1008171 [Cordylochernes scorpioides]|uniref:Histone-lysine N-methyltransferase SETMAR n=1 Tax=Cordylochernes scorpioides TaxID=51811 RepID=A0ABY6K1L4_9ARAC|nr:hypothetical protein LAZ67_1008171 [Cordylochernes scorpioides]